MDFFILKGRKVVACDAKAYAKFCQIGENARVASDYVNGSHISTVFLGTDHNAHFSRWPMFFETLVFNGPIDGHMDRCGTYDEAEEMHKRMLERVKDSYAIEGRKSAEVLQIASHPNFGDYA